MQLSARFHAKEILLLHKNISPSRFIGEIIVHIRLIFFLLKIDANFLLLVIGK